MSDFEDVQKLIRLKRYERPPDEYFDEFLGEFQRRQRSEILNRSARSLFFERVATYFSGFGKAGWVYGAGAAYAVVMLVFFAIPHNRKQAKAPSGDDPMPVSSKMEVRTPSPAIRNGREAASSIYYPVDRRKLKKEGEAKAVEVPKDIEWF